MELRAFESVTEGSDTGERLCANVLEPAADFFAGEKFKESDLDKIIQDREYHHEDESVVCIYFLAYKNFDKNNMPVIHYNVQVSQRRLLTENDYWPEVDEDAARLVGVGAAEDEYEDDDEDDDYEDEPSVYEVFENDCRYVEEVQDYFYDEFGHKPHKSLRYQYYHADGTLYAVINGSKPAETSEILSENPDLDVDMHLLDGSFGSAFSEIDVSEIKGILNTLGFRTSGV